MSLELKIADLPDELLCTIFHHLDQMSNATLMRCIPTVCKSFARICATQMYGMTLQYTEGDCISLPEHFERFPHTTKLRVSPAHTLTPSEIRLEFSNFDGMLARSAFKSLVSLDLTFCDILASRTRLKKIMKCCVKLEAIILNNCRQADPGSLKCLVSHPTLRSVEVLGSDTAWLSMPTRLERLVGVLCITRWPYKRTRVLRNLAIVIDARIILDGVSTIVESVLCPSLERLSIVFAGGWHFKSRILTLIAEACPNLTHLHICCPYGHTELHHLAPCKNLKMLHMNVPYTAGPVVLSPALLFFMYYELTSAQHQHIKATYPQLQIQVCRQYGNLLGTGFGDRPSWV
jgi:hypothetical protein